MDTPKIGIVLGSASDLPYARKIGETLNELEIPFEVTIASAHRTPGDTAAYARSARSRGLNVVIAVAGLSAALPGAVAALTTLPVIGLPVESGPLSGMDALLSTAMMPPGVPVASVGVGAAVNAALLAARVVAAGGGELVSRLRAYADKKAAGVRAARADANAFGGLPMTPEEAFR